MATPIEQFMDSLFFQRLVAERALTSPDAVVSLAREVMARPDFDIEGAFARGDVTPTTDPGDFLRAVQRPMRGDGGGPSDRQEEAGPTPGQQAATQAAQVGRENQAAATGWANAVQAGEFEKADKTLSDLAASRGAKDVEAPTVSALAQLGAESFMPGAISTIEDVTKNIESKLGNFFTELTSAQPGMTSAQKQTMQFSLSAVPVVGPALSMIAGITMDLQNLELQNQTRERLGLPQLEVGMPTLLGRNAPFVSLFTEPVTSYPVVDGKSYFSTRKGDPGFETNDPAMTDQLMGFTAPETPSVSISRSAPPGFERSLSPPPGTGWAEEDPQPKTAAQLAAKGRTPAELSKWGFTDEEIGNVFGSFNANWGGPPLDELIGLFGWGGWDSNGGTNTDTPGGWGPGTDSESNMSGFG